MRNKTKKLLRTAYSILAALIITGCSNNPKIIAAEEPVQDVSNVFKYDGPVIATDEIRDEPSSDLHTVKVIESLPTAKYVYVRATEGNREFWVATSKMEVEIGATYFFRGGLLKRDFQSKEYQRSFEELYLVSSFVKADHGNKTRTSSVSNASSTKIVKSSEPVEGSTSIADLVKNPQTYAGKEVQLSGTCTKINPNIMGRNWIHLKDGSKDDFDLVVTTNFQVPVGHEVTLKGVVVLKKDFGSGYYYDILIENGELVSSL